MVAFSRLLFFVSCNIPSSSPCFHTLSAINMPSSGDQTEVLRQYLQHLFKIQVKAIPSSTKFVPPKKCSQKLRAECERIAPLLARAYLWQGMMSLLIVKINKVDYDNSLAEVER